MQTDSEWPPAYSIKRNPRARHVKMVYSQARGLQITVPIRFSVKHVPAIIDENKAWIIKQQKIYEHLPPVKRPDDIHLLAFNQHWTVHYFENLKAPRIKQFNSNGLILSGHISELDTCREKLSDWVKKQAKLLLIPYFQKLAVEIGLPFLDVSVRSQITLWGSCSQDKSIRLNYKLLFLPEVLMRHIMIHELCHTRYMNHSEQFWRLVASHDPDWMLHKKLMKQADKYMPAWIK